MGYCAANCGSPGGLLISVPARRGFHPHRARDIPANGKNARFTVISLNLLPTGGAQNMLCFVPHAEMKRDESIVGRSQFT